MEKLKVGLAAGGQTESSIQKGIFQGNLFSPSLFVIAMMSVTYILRKCEKVYKFTKLQVTKLIQVICLYSQNIGIDFWIK